jgi:hypothetical protein
MACELEIKVDREDRKYAVGKDKYVNGCVIFKCEKETPHSGIQLAVEGLVNIKIEGKVLTKNLKPTQVMYSVKDLAKPGKLPMGETKFDFKFNLEALTGQELYETFHGWAVNIKYFLKCTCLRTGLFTRQVYRDFEFMVLVNTKEEIPAPKEVAFHVTQSSLPKKKKAEVNVNELGTISVRGKLTSTTCHISKPLTGELVVEECELDIRSITLQLIRIETCSTDSGYAREVSEVQNTEIVTGDVCRQFAVPIYLLFPRLYSCPTVHTSIFRIEFAVNVIVKLANGVMLQEQFPILLVRV